MIATVQVSGDWKSILEGPARQELESTILPRFLRGQRWFGGKGRRLEAVTLTDWGDFPAGGNRVYLLLIEVRFAEGKNDLYFLPIGIAGGEAAARLLRELQSWVIARLVGPAGEALLHDALGDDSTCTALVEAIGSQHEFALRSGRVRAFPTGAFARLRGRVDQPLPVKRGPATSSNSLIFYEQRLLLKLFRRLEAGINPDFEIGRYLTESNAFPRIPQVGGGIEYRRDNAEPITLAILQSAVANQGDGWHHALDELHSYYERIGEAEFSADPLEERSLVELADAEPPAAVRQLIGDYLDAAATLGRRTAELHRALTGGTNPDFAPEPFTAADAAALWQSIREQGKGALAALHDNLDRIPEDVAPSARQLLEQGPETLRQVRQAAPFDGNAVKIRCHGDYHLGQVLRVENDYVLLDFEGEPVRPVAQRRAKQSPLKDVAGMLRSYHYAAYAGLFARAENQDDKLARLVPWAERWSQWVSAAFLRAYRAAADGQAFLPSEPALFAALLEAFMLDKAFYELNYELNNRPDWVRIPLRGILMLLEGERKLV